MRRRPLAILLTVAMVSAVSATASAADGDPSPSPAADSGRPELSSPVERPGGPAPAVSTAGQPSAKTTQKGVRVELWAPADPTENGDWVSARIRVTNVGRTPIKVSGYPDNLACQSPVASWIDLTGLWDVGRTWEGNAEAFRRAYLDEGPSVIDVEVMPDGSEAACLDIGRPDGKLAAGASFEVPLATWVRYLWRDQPLPSGTAELVSTFRFNRPSRQPGQRRGSIELRVPLEIAGADVSYPSPQELVDTALDQPEFLAWIETRRFDKSWNPSSHRLAEGFGQSEFAGGPAPMDTIQVGAFADGSVPENWGRVTIDPWDGSVRAVDITG